MRFTYVPGVMSLSLPTAEPSDLLPARVGLNRKGRSPAGVLERIRSPSNYAVIGAHHIPTIQRQ